MKRILYNSDGTVGIIHAVANKKPDETLSDWKSRVFDKATKGLPFDDVEDYVVDMLPRIDRNAWVGVKGVGLSVDAVKKKTIDDEILIKKEEVDVLRLGAIENLKTKGKIPLKFVDTKLK